jgi:hypothetical protein
MITIFDIKTEIRKALDDALITTTGNVNTTSGAFLSDDQLLGFILKHAYTEGDYYFPKLIDGYYSYPGDAYFFSPTFDETAYCDYVFYSTGSIVVSDETPGADNETRTQIKVHACMVNFNRIIADCFIYLANKESKTLSQSSDIGTINPNTIRQELMAQAAHWAICEWLET